MGEGREVRVGEIREKLLWGKATLTVTSPGCVYFKIGTHVIHV